MKYIMMLGLAAMAATALMAIGDSTASATTLTNEEGKHPTTIEMTSMELTWSMAGGAFHIVCSHSSMHGHLHRTGTPDEGDGMPTASSHTSASTAAAAGR